MGKEKEITDETLMQRVQKGDVAAYKILFAQYKGIVMGFSYKITGDRALAEEVLQETFWRVWDRAARFDNTKGKFTTWMFGIARNLSIDMLRKHSRVEVQSLVDNSHDEHAENGMLLKDEQNVADDALLILQQEQVRYAMAGLPSEQREVIERIYFWGQTRRQIAREVDIPFGTVNTRANLGLKKLRRALQAQGFEG